MTVLDYLVLIVVAASIIAGAAKGLVKAIISVASVFVGLIAATHLYGFAAGLFRGLGSSARAANLLGFAAVFVIVLIAGAVAARWLRKGLKRARMGWADHLLGAVFGLLRGWLICSVLYLALTAFPVKLEAVEGAMFAPVLLEGTRIVAYLTSSELRTRFWDGYRTVQGLWGRTNGNLSKAAEELRIHRNTLSKRVEKYYQNGNMTGARHRRPRAAKTSPPTRPRGGKTKP